MGLFQLLVDLARERLGIGLGENALVEQLARVLVTYGGLLGDPRGHQRLCVRGLVLLVVAEAPVADEIDDDVVLEAAAVGHSQANGGDAGLGIVGVDVDDREIEALGEVTRVPR